MWVCGSMGERTMDGNAAGGRAGEEGGQERFGVDPPEREASAPGYQLGKCLEGVSHLISYIIVVSGADVRRPE